VALPGGRFRWSNPQRSVIFDVKGTQVCDFSNENQHPSKWNVISRFDPLGCHVSHEIFPFDESMNWIDVNSI